MTCQNETLEGKQKFFNNYGAISLVEKVQRAQPTEFGETPRNRRAIAPRTFVHHEVYDIDDEVRLHQDMEPNSALMAGYGYAAARKKDDLIVEAYDGTAYSGETGATAVVFDTAQDILHGSADMTLAKIIEAKKKLLVAEIDPDEEMFAVCHPEQLDAMLRIEKLTSSDYVSVQALMNGTINQFMGFTWKITTRIAVNTGTLRYAFFYARPAIILGTFKEVSIKIAERADLNYATQVSIIGTMAATRQFENQIVRVDNDDAVA
jgi:hypothetical protein